MSSHLPGWRLKSHCFQVRFCQQCLCPQTHSELSSQGSDRMGDGCAALSSALLPKLVGGWVDLLNLFLSLQADSPGNGFNEGW